MALAHFLAFCLTRDCLGQSQLLACTPWHSSSEPFTNRESRRGPVPKCHFFLD